MVTHFPRIDEVFVLREINELERHGQPVVVVPLIRLRPQVVHEEAKPWMKRALFTPLLSATILASNLRTFVKAPLRYLRTLLTLIAGTIWRPSTLVRSVVLFPKSVHLATVLAGMGVKHVHAHFATHSTTAAWIISSVSDLTYSFTVHGPDVFVHRMLLDKKIAGAKFVRCISMFNKAFIAGLYPHLAQGKLHVIHTGVNPDVYAEAASASRAARRRATLQLLSVAALTPSRGFPILIDAVERLIRAGVDIECRIVGEGRLRPATERWIARHGIEDRVRLLGALPQHEVARLMGEADIFVLPSIIAVDGQMDGIPVSLMEAMAAGKAVVAAAISGIPEIVKHEVNGLLVDAAYPQRIEAAVRRLVEDAALRERIGQGGRETVRQRFDVRRTSASLIALLDATADVNQPAQSTADRIMALNWSRLNAADVGVRRVHERADFTIAEVTISDGVAKQEVVVRQHCGPTPAVAQERARREFEVLTMLGSALAESKLTIPRLLMFDEPNAAIVVARADGKSLAGMLRESQGARATALRKAGAWVRTLQEHTRTDDDPRYVVTGVVLQALEDLDLACAGDGILRVARTIIRERLQTLESSVTDHPLTVVGTHGHFSPDNIFLGSGGVNVVHFGSYREGLPLEDVAELLMHLDLLGAASSRRAFLEGYGQPADAEELQLFSLTSALRLFARGGLTSAQRRKLRALILRRAA